jgi:hypothetical protein
MLTTSPVVTPEQRGSKMPVARLEGHLRGPGLAALLALAAATPTAAAGPAPVLPCAPGAEVVPAYAPIGPAPSVGLWQMVDLPADWTPTACTGWAPRADAKLVVSAGRFRAADASEILERLGAISRQREIRYWSVRRDDWKTLLDDAFALTGPDLKARRADFAPAEFVEGAKLYAAYDDSEPVGAIVELLQVRVRTPDRLVIAGHNLTAARMMGFPVADKGELEVVFFFDREDGDVWRYYGITRTRLNLPETMSMPDADYMNRSAATFRFIAGYASDASPPVASN